MPSSGEIADSFPIGLNCAGGCEKIASAFPAMIELKVQCDCGQKYKFDVEPVNGRMPFTVNCPVCGLDGTEKANGLLQQMAAPPPVPAAPAGVRLGVAAPPAPSGAVAAAAPRPVVPTRPPQRRSDGWEKSESDFNKLGSYVMLIPSILGAMLAAGFFGIEVSPLILGVIVGVCGLVGGVINIMGRGPIVVGMLVGLVMALGGYGAVFWWVQGKTRVYKFELVIAFAIGAAPGFGLQFLFQKILLKRKQQIAA